MANFSNNFKINVNRLNAQESVIVLLEIDHPLIPETIRLVRDNCDVVSNGETYNAMAFDFKRQDDVQGEVPKVTLQVQNIGRSLVKWIDQSGGGKDAEITALLIRRSSPNLIEERIKLQIERISITNTVINFSLVVQNNLVRRGIKYIYSVNRAPGLF
jgi:hypothetical protein